MFGQVFGCGCLNSLLHKHNKQLVHPFPQESTNITKSSMSMAFTLEGADSLILPFSLTPSLCL